MRAYEKAKSLTTEPFQGDTREDYLKWRVEWRANYKELSRIIREIRATRKTFQYEYRAKGDNSSPKRKAVGPNQNRTEWPGCEDYFVNAAREMMEIRIESKIIAGNQRARRLAEEQAAA